VEIVSPIRPVPGVFAPDVSVKERGGILAGVPAGLEVCLVSRNADLSDI
jgi:hypothetical protein